MPGSRKNLFGVAFISLAGLMVFLFQNCGSLNPAGSAITAQSATEVQFSNDQAALSRLLNSPSFQTWFSAKQSSISSSSGIVTTITSLLPSGLNLSPAAATSGPSIGVSTTLSPTPILTFSSNANLKTNSAQDFFTNAASIIVLVEGTSVTGKVASINDGTSGSNELGISFASGRTIFSHQNSAGNSSTVSTGLQGLQNDFILSVAFGKSSSAITAQVNGFSVNNAPVVVGAPADNGYVLRQLTLGDATVASGFKIAEMMVFSSELSAPEINALTRYVAKKWNVSSSMGYVPFTAAAGPSGATADALPANVAAIMNICIGCHVGYHSAFATYGVADYVSKGLVIPGDAANSPIYQQTSSGLMPLAPTAPLTASQLLTLQNWINGLQ